MIQTQTANREPHRNLTGGTDDFSTPQLTLLWSPSIKVSKLFDKMAFYASGENENSLELIALDH